MQLAEGQDVYQLLGSPYRDLWLHWLEEGNEAYTQQAKNSNQERLDFVRSVVAAAAASSAAATQNGGAEPTQNAAAAAADAKAVPKVSITVKTNAVSGMGLTGALGTEQSETIVSRAPHQLASSGAPASHCRRICKGSTTCMQPSCLLLQLASCCNP